MIESSSHLKAKCRDGKRNGSMEAGCSAGVGWWANLPRSLVRHRTTGARGAGRGPATARREQGTLGAQRIEINRDVYSAKYTTQASFKRLILLASPLHIDTAVSAPGRRSTRPFDPDRFSSSSKVPVSSLDLRDSDI